jgi:carbamoyltransferase
LQTVKAQTYPWMFELVGHMGRLTGVPVVPNTSFNIMGKPIVDCIDDALAVLCSTGLDAVLVEDFLVRKRRAQGGWPLT